MTRRELSQLYHLRQEIFEDRERLHKLESVATSMSPTSGSQGGFGIPTDRTAIASSIADLRSQIAGKVAKECEELIRLMDYIDTIDNAYVRRIFKLRFVDGRSWQAVAVRVGGTSDSVKKICYRFLDKS